MFKNMKVKPLYNYVLCKLLKRQICVISMILILKKKKVNYQTNYRWHYVQASKEKERRD